MKTLFDHVVWADRRARESIQAIDPGRPERAEAMRIYSHLAASEHTWLSRINGTSPLHTPWPELPLEEATALARESVAGLRAIAAGDAASLSREVDYLNSAGQSFRNRVADILTHVALHGSYHRGQLALLTRRSGAAPAPTDYIVYLRDVAARGGRA